MLTLEDDIDVHALARQGWSISAIARHTGHDRKTIRAYLSGQRAAGARAMAGPDLLEPFIDYMVKRLAEDPHLLALTLFEEVTELGYDRSYPTFTREIRARSLRPVCEPCHPAKDRPASVIEHPPGAETQWDWVELPDPPRSWGWGAKAHLLVGSLAHSGRWRGTLEAFEDQPHLVEALDRTTRALGGLTRAWRFDRMSTVCDPGTGRVSHSFAGVAKYYGVDVKICPARRGNSILSAGRASATAWVVRRPTTWSSPRTSSPICPSAWTAAVRRLPRACRVGRSSESPHRPGPAPRGRIRGTRPSTVRLPLEEDYRPRGVGRRRGP